ncbi:unnamed protein product [Paramecium sonneborni]|uniref:Protein kinase domain-containing protein n=1 Tax=Paramecium sonneborni TaxID=65129 RepID=A0A8S1QQE5_9CILI|nr:unnamed protein product [Paramecium sonneborni]
MIEPAKGNSTFVQDGYKLQVSQLSLFQQKLLHDFTFSKIQSYYLLYLLYLQRIKQKQQLFITSLIKEICQFISRIVFLKVDNNSQEFLLRKLTDFSQQCIKNKINGQLTIYSKKFIFYVIQIQNALLIQQILFSGKFCLDLQIYRLFYDENSLQININKCYKILISLNYNKKSHSIPKSKFCFNVLLKESTFSQIANIIQYQQIKVQYFVNQQNPKYRYSLSLDKIFSWIVKENKIIGFQLPYENKIKDFYGNHNDLLNLKIIMGGFVCYEKIDKFYKKDEIIQSGSFGNVTKETCRFTQKAVAIKNIKLENNDVPTIKNEIIILKKLKDSKNILKLQEIFRDDNNFYIVTEYIPGSNLKQIMEYKQKPFQIKESLKIMEQILLGLQSIHQAGIIHRDLKPANLMYHKNQIKIIDFGLACLNGNQLQQYPTCGTAGYSAPEVLNAWNKKFKYDYKVDLFSIGCIFYQLLTLQCLFQGENQKETIYQNKQCQYTIKEIGPPFDLVKLFIQPDPKERIDVTQALEAIQMLQEYKTFDINFWFHHRLKQSTKGKSNCEFNFENKNKLDRQFSITSLKTNNTEKNKIINNQ